MQPIPTNVQKNKLEKIVNAMDLFKRFFVSLLLIVLSVALLFLFIKNSFKKQLVIKPFKISSSLQNAGYTGEILTTLFLDKIKEYQQTGASLYRTNKVVLPSWENSVDEINVAFDNSIFSEAKSLFEYFGSRNSQYANGQIIKVDSLYTMQLSIDVHSFTISNKKSIYDLLSSAAELILKYLDPYNLAGFYLHTGQLDNCNLVAQQLLNDNDKSNDGLAMHLRGLVYLKKGDTPTAKLIFLKALQSIKSPWLTYNNLGVIYYKENKNDSARMMFLKSLELNDEVFSAYFNYGNLLYGLYQDNHNSKVLDSAITNYQTAINLNKNEKILYLAILAPLADLKDQTKFEEYSMKLLEMDQTYYLNYFQIGLIKKTHGAPIEANRFFEQAITLCQDSIGKLQISHFITK